MVELARENELLRRLLAEACDGWEDCSSSKTVDDPPTRIDAIREEAGLIESAIYCSQCGWSGRSFHACEGVPGGFSDDEDRDVVDGEALETNRVLDTVRVDG